MDSAETPIAVFGGDLVFQLDEFSINESFDAITASMGMSGMTFRSPETYNTVSFHHGSVVYVLRNYVIDQIDWTVDEYDDMSETIVDISAESCRVYETI